MRLLLTDPLALPLPTDDANANSVGLFSHRDQLARFIERANEISIFNRIPVMVNEPCLDVDNRGMVQPRDQSPTNSNPSGSAGQGGASSKGRSFSFKCPLCTLQYRTQAFLNDHMRNEHSILI